MALKSKSEGGEKIEIVLPEGVSASVDAGSVVSVKGAKGAVGRKFMLPSVSFRAEQGSRLVIESLRSTKREKKLVRSLSAHIRNMIKGASEGHVYKLRICYTHFPVTASVEGEEFVVKNFLGEKVPRRMRVPEGVSVVVKKDEVTVESADREAAGQFAASVEQLTRRKNYDQRVFGDGIYITVKDGKELK